MNNTTAIEMEELLREAQELQAEAFRQGRGVSIVIYDSKLKNYFSLDIINGDDVKLFSVGDYSSAETNKEALEQARAYMDKIKNKESQTSNN